MSEKIKGSKTLEKESFFLVGLEKTPNLPQIYNFLSTLESKKRSHSLDSVKNHNSLNIDLELDKALEKDI